MVEAAGTIWKEREVGLESAKVLAQQLGISPVLARVLMGRGIHSPEAAARFLAPSLSMLTDPFLFADMDKATDRLLLSILTGEVIGIFGDYDVDGVCSSAVLSGFLESTGAKVLCHIPNRMTDGYGVNVKGLVELKEKGAKLIVTVDCGISAIEPLAQAKAMGLDVIVVDHHTVPKQFPEAFAIVNPHRADCPRQGQHFCAAGVVFNLCMALRKKMREAGCFSGKEPQLTGLLDAVALATVADVVPLVEDNRVIVAHGLKVLKEKRRPGLKALMQVAGLKENKITASSLGFQFGPRINAAGRLDDAMAALKLLKATNYDDALAMAAALDDHNQQRRDHEKEIVASAIAEIESSPHHQDQMVLVVGNPSWHPGVVGIVASRLVERFARPTIVVGENGKGSGRSIAAFHLHDALSQIPHLLKGFGGHAHAVGVHVDLDQLAHFRQALNDIACAQLKPSDLIHTLLHDGEVPLLDVDEALIAAISQAAPFGRGNPEPMFVLRGVTLENCAVLNGGHLRGKFAGSCVSFIAFGMAERMKEIPRRVDALGVLDINEWGSQRSIQMRIRDFRAA